MPSKGALLAEGLRRRPRVAQPIEAVDKLTETESPELARGRAMALALRNSRGKAIKRGMGKP